MIFSDHSFVFSQIGVQIIQELHVNEIPKNVINYEVLTENLNILLNTDFSNVLDPNDLYCTFIAVMENLIGESTETVSIKRSKNDPLCPWFNYELKSLSLKTYLN